MNGQQAQAIEKMADGDNVMEIGFKRLSENAVLPKRNNDTDSGFDVYASEDIIVRPGETVVVKTDIAVVLPPYHEAYIKNRSGVASKTKLRVVSPPIDEGYRGAVGVIIDNIAQFDYAEVDFLLTLDGGTFNIPPIPKRAGACSNAFAGKVPHGTYLIRKGDRIAQLTVQPRPNVVSCEVTGELDETSRGGNGFGSSGV